MTITVQNHQRRVPINLRWLRRFAECARTEVLHHCDCPERAVLPELSTVEVAIVSDEAIAVAHERFMAIAGPTDVITFQHGELLLSADTALANAAAYGHSIEEELALYTLHGLLHLNGFEDGGIADAARMEAVQNLAFRACLAKVPLPLL